MIKNIIFDLGNIIIKCDRDRIIDYYAKNKEEKEYLKNEIFNSIEWKSMDYGDIDIKESMEIINKRNEYKYEKITKDFFSDWYKRYDINEDIVNIAKKLKEKGYSIFVISNFGKESYEYYKNTCDFFKLPTGIIVSSYEHLLKPDEKIYKILLDRYNLNAEECIFIDDSKYNYETANKLGIKGRFVKANDAEDILKMLEEFGVEI